MSIEQKIAELLEDADKLQEQATQNEEVAEELDDQIVEEDSVELPEEFADMSAEELKEFMQTEEFEQLDELSKTTLKSYAKKAVSGTKGLGVQAYKTGHSDASNKPDAKAWHKTQRRNVGLNKAIDRLSKEEYAVDVSEDVAALLNGETLSEEFQSKAATIFEAAVVSRVKAEIASLEEQFDVRLQEEVETIREGLIEQVDGYLNYVVEQWMTDNELALENGMKNEILESFVHGMKGLFEQHYIDVPEEKFDIIGEMQAQIEDLSEKLDEQFAANVEMNQHLKELVRESAIEEFASDMTVMDSDKFKGLAEELVFEDEDSFKAKLQTIKENYFGKKQSAQKITERFITEETTGSLNEEVDVNPTMARYLRALNGAK